MGSWFTHSNAVDEHYKNPFTSNLLNLWSRNSKNKNKNKWSKEFLYAYPSISTRASPTITTTPIISTRGHFSLVTGKLNSLRDKSNYDYYHAPRFLGNYYLNSNELVIYIHGVWTEQRSAKEQTDRTRLALCANGYNIPIIGFSWDSNTAVNPSGWSIAKHIANQNGSKIAKFISDFKNNYPNINIRIIAHSLGAKVVESALITLNNENNQIWKKNTSYSIASIHLLGAAIDDKSASKNTPFGNAIENTVDKFYNLYNPEDNALKYAYVKTENQNPLGLYGLKKGEPSPINYTERNVKFEIPPLKRASGIYQSFCDKAVYGWGDNHCGYIGFRERYPYNQFIKDDGAINVIVTDWRTDTKIYR
jgi:hypothetical protein